MEVKNFSQYFDFYTDFEYFADLYLRPLEYSPMFSQLSHVVSFQGS